jgi:murein DD-endopeptidase MepM/ murein hydrolase activator NlpD
VKKGELIAYLGDPDENGGSAGSPLVPHLHFGIRAGQRADYPGKGEWRWQAGWIAPCPRDLGWLQPSAVIMSQHIPTGGHPGPASAFLDLWGIELLVTGAYSVFGVGLLVTAIRKKKPLFMPFPGVILIAAGIVLLDSGMVRTFALLAIGILLTGIGIVAYSRRSVPKQPDRS